MVTTGDATPLVARRQAEDLFGRTGVHGQRHLAVAVDQHHDVAGAHLDERTRQARQVALAAADQLDRVAELGRVEALGVEVEGDVAEAVDQHGGGAQAALGGARRRDLEAHETGRVDLGAELRRRQAGRQAGRHGGEDVAPVEGRRQRLEEELARW